MRLPEKLGLDLPIIQAPMAGVSTPELAAVVSNAGALGSISVGAMSVETARVAIEQTRSLTDRPFNVNVFCHPPARRDPEIDAAWLAMLSPAFEKFDAKPPAELEEIYLSFNHNEPMLALLLETRPSVVSFHFGLPPQTFIDALKHAGIVLLASATNLEEAKLCEQAGVDAVIAQGIEAGGHRGVFDPKAPDAELSALELTRLLAKEINLPVMAAGGIMTGQDIRAALDAGAQAAQLGTAFIGCPESSADDDFRAALKSPRAEQTILTPVFSGRTARGLPNAYSAMVETHANFQIPAYPLPYHATKALAAAAKKAGSPEYATQLAGQGASRTRMLPAAELVRLLQKELAENGGV